MGKTRRTRGGAPVRRNSRKRRKSRRAKSLSPKRHRHSRKHRPSSARYSPGARKRWDSDVRKLPDEIDIVDAFAYDYGKPAIEYKQRRR